MKRFLSCVLTLAMMLAMVPAARAAGDGLPEQPVPKVNTDERRGEAAAPLSETLPAKALPSQGDVLPGEPVMKIYVSNTGDDGNSGGSADAPVKTLKAAVGKLNGGNGTVVLMNRVGLGADGTYTYLAQEGNVTFTGRDEGTEYPEAGIYFDWKKGAHYHLTPQATVEYLTFTVNPGGNARLYASDSLTIGEGVATVKEDGSRTFFLCGGYAQTDSEASSLTVLSGTYDRIYACNDYKKINTAALVVGGTAAGSLIAGGNTANGSVDITIQGGSYEGLTLPALSGGSIGGDMTVRLEGGSLGGFVKAGTSNGKLNVTVDGGTLQTTGTVDGFTTASLTINGLSGQLPAGLLAAFDESVLTGQSQAVYPSSDLSTQSITVTAGSSLTLSGYTSKPLGVTWSGEGTVTVAEPEYTDSAPVLLLDFEDGAAHDASGRGNDGTLHGDPAFGLGYDGGKALYLKNEFGVPAQQYITFWNLKGVDISRNDFTLVFWYKSVNGGNDEWALAANAANAGDGLDFTNAKRGGLIFSNKDYSSLTASGIAMANMAQPAYIVSGVTDIYGGRHERTGIWQLQDERWHRVAAVYDRSGAYTIYVDGEETASFDISDAEGQALGSNFLALGADLAGEYGLGNAYVDDFTLYPAALPYLDIQAGYRLDALKALICEVEERLKTVGPEYDAADVQAMAEKTAGMKALAATLTVRDQARADEARTELKEAFDAFLLSPAGKADQTMLLLSDIHINTAGARGAELKTVFADLKKLRTQTGLEMDGVVSAGDFADNASVEAGNKAFDLMNEVLSDYGSDTQLIAALGNHEVNYINENQRFTTGAYTYRDRVQEHISDGEDRVYGGGVLDDKKNFCYGMTLGGYHYLVLNTDEQEQTGNAQTEVQNGRDGNAVDPIRHGVIFESDTLEWIDGMLAGYSEDGKPTFVVCHFPFIDSVPLSYYREQRVEDNSIGTQDKILREMFAKYDNLVYFCGHLHSSVALSGPVAVTTAAGDSFTEVNLSSLKGAARGYTRVPTSWIMFVYDTEIVLRARDFTTGEWLTAYDAVIPIAAPAAYVPPAGSSSTVKTETTVNGDGSKTVTKTDRATGAVTTTTTYPGGAVVKTVVSAAGDSRTEVTVPAGKRAEVLIPSAERGNTAVAVLTLPDGTEQILPDSMPAEGGVRATVPASGTVRVVTADGGYADVPVGSWYAEAAAFVGARGILRGTGKDTFAPGTEVTRGTLMTALARLAGEDTSAGETWWQLGLEWSKAQGISDGTDPDGLITREQLAAMLWRYAGSPESGESLADFADCGAVSPWAAEAMAWAVETGIVKGRSGLLACGGTATRAEVSAMLMRFLLSR